MRRKIVDGIEYILSPEEEAQVIAREQEFVRLAQENEQKLSKKKSLENKYKDPFEALDKICKHLKIDFETLGE